MIEEMVIAFGIIFFAEMGDKSQMLAMAFASKYKIKYVIIGMFLGILLNHILAVFLGQMVGQIIPLNALSITAGILFLIYGFWSLSIEEETSNKKIFRYGPILAVSTAFFIGELGDKTQLATFTLASDANYPLFILVGTVSGMMVVGSLGIYVGMKMGSKIPEEIMKVLSGFVFLVFGTIKLYQTLPSNYTVFAYVFLFISLTMILFVLRAIPLYQSFANNRQTAFKDTAEELRLFYSDLYERLDGICLGENVCGGCDGHSCLVSFTKTILRNAQDSKDINLDSVYDINHQKNFPKDKVMESLLLVLKKLQHDDFRDEQKVLTKLRHNYEQLLIKHHIHDYKSKEHYINSVAYYDKFVAKQLRLNWT